jgi:hypothetical protein
MSRSKDIKNTAKLMAISGSEDIQNLPMQIEDDYLMRERMENLREDGFRVPEKYQPESRTEKEKQIWLNQKRLQDLEKKRYLEAEEEEESHLEKEIDEDYKFNNRRVLPVRRI